MKVWIGVALAAVAEVAAAQIASPQTGNAERGRALLGVTGPSALDLQRMNPLQLQQYLCSNKRLQIQEQLDMQAAGSTGVYNMESLRADEARLCSAAAMDLARQKTEAVLGAPARHDAEVASLQPGQCTAVKPLYPPAAIRMKHEGVSVVRGTLGQGGTMESVEVLTSSGFPDIDKAALHAVRSVNCNAPAGAQVTLPVTFSLHKI